MCEVNITITLAKKKIDKPYDLENFRIVISDFCGIEVNSRAG